MSIQAQNTELNIVPGGIIPVVHVSQYDVDRVLTFNLYDRNSEASLASGTTAVIEGTKPDGNGFQYAATITGNTVTVNTTIQMTVLSGTVDCKIVLRNGSQVIGTALFIMDVEKAGINENTPMSETDLPLIIAEATEQMERAEAAAIAAALSEENAEAEALKAEGYATGKQNGEEVSSESPYYHNNAEYYSEYAESIADRLPEGLSPKGTCVFADLPSISESIVGDMWVISDSFITTSDFRGGSGVSVPSGAYVYLTDSNKWDILPSVETVNPVDYEEDIYGVNLLKPVPSTVNSGVSYTVDEDGIVNASGTASNSSVLTYYRYIKAGTYDISGCPANGSTSSYAIMVQNQDQSSTYVWDTGTGGTFTLDSDAIVCVKIRIAKNYTANNLVFHPMLRKANLKVDDYMPFNQQSIQNQITDQTNVLGAKNLVENKAITKTLNGVTFTVRSDGSINLYSASTPSGNVDFKINDSITLPAGNYRLKANDFPSTDYSARIALSVRDASPYREVAYDANYDNHAHCEFTLTEETTLILRIYINPNSIGALNNKVIYPMITPASVVNRKFAPHAMTNRELTVGKLDVGKVLTSSDDLNNIMETGLYIIRDSTPTNSPESTNWCSLLVNKVGDNNVHQQLFKGQYLYQRKYSGASPTWESWYKFTGTVVS